LRLLLLSIGAVWIQWKWNVLDFIHFNYYHAESDVWTCSLNRFSDIKAAVSWNDAIVHGWTSEYIVIRMREGGTFSTDRILING